MYAYGDQLLDLSPLDADSDILVANTGQTLTSSGQVV